MLTCTNTPVDQMQQKLKRCHETYPLSWEYAVHSMEKLLQPRGPGF
jgi:hypothetical protein